MTKRARLATGALALALPFTLAVPAASQTSNDDLRREIDSLKQGQQKIQQELAELKKLIEQRQAAPARPAGPSVAGKIFSLGANPVKGVPSARLTLIEFMDYQ